MNKSTHALVRAFTALLTIWFLGCTSFDILIEQAIHGNEQSAAECAMGQESGAVSSVGSTTIHVDVERSTGCGCDHCIALRVVAFALEMDRPSPPDADVRELKPAHSIDREPLVPPPVVA